MSSRANFVYLPPRRAKTLAFIRHFVQHKTFVPTFYVSDAPEMYKDTGLEIARMPALVNEAQYGDLPFFRLSDHYAAQAFLNTVKLAVSMGLAEFMWIEDDCWVKGEAWDKQSWREWDLHTPLQVCSGYPCVAGLLSSGLEWESRLIAWAAQFLALAGLPPTFEPMRSCDFDRGVSGPIVFPNGAFAIYNVAALQECFVRPLAAFYEHRYDVIFFDIRFGLWLAKTYGARLLDAVLPTRHIYSGCGHHHVNKVERRELMSKKNGIHNWVHETA